MILSPSSGKFHKKDFLDSGRKSDSQGILSYIFLTLAALVMVSYGNIKSCDVYKESHVFCVLLLDTNIGVGGMLLSGGQRQRIGEINDTSMQINKRNFPHS